MNEKDRKVLESLGWTPELLRIAAAANENDSVDRMFLDRARAALAAAGVSALEFLTANPGVSKIELAERLNRGVSAIGLIMAIYDEAAENGIVRDTAKDLLIRRIHAEFPQGWSSCGNVHPAVKLSSWDAEAAKYGRDPRIAGYVDAIVRELAIHHPPADGWKPNLQTDSLIDELFDRFWPADVSSR
jgi:hypothetical protein